MNELNKTVTFVGVALLLGVVAFASAPRRAVPDLFFDVGEPFFPDFTDPEAAATLDVVEFDEETAAATPFRVTHRGGALDDSLAPRLPGRRRRAPVEHRRGHHQPGQGGLPLRQRGGPRSARRHRPDRSGRPEPDRPRDARHRRGRQRRGARRPHRRPPGREPARAPVRPLTGTETGPTRPASRRTSRPASRTGSSRTCWRSSGTRWSTSS